MCLGPVVLVHRVRSWRYGVRAQAASGPCNTVFGSNASLNPDRQTENYLRPSFETFSGRGILKEEPVPKEWTWHELALYVARAARDLGEPFSKLDPFYVRLIIDQKITYQGNYSRTLLAPLVDDDITLSIQEGLLPRDWSEEQGHDHAPAQSHGDGVQPEPKAKADAKAKAKAGVARSNRKRPAGTGRATKRWAPASSVM